MDLLQSFVFCGTQLWQSFIFFSDLIIIVIILFSGSTGMFFDIDFGIQFVCSRTDKIAKDVTLLMVENTEQLA